jgi:hypothetical protein
MYRTSRVTPYKFLQGHVSQNPRKIMRRDAARVIFIKTHQNSIGNALGYSSIPRH